jgi:hypothetical protein
MFVATESSRNAWRTLETVRTPTGSAVPAHWRISSASKSKLQRSKRLHDDEMVRSVRRSALPIAKHSGVFGRSLRDSVAGPALSLRATAVKPTTHAVCSASWPAETGTLGEVP